MVPDTRTLIGFVLIAATPWLLLCAAFALGYWAASPDPETGKKALAQMEKRVCAVSVSVPMADVIEAAEKCKGADWVQFEPDGLVERLCFWKNSKGGALAEGGE